MNQVILNMLSKYGLDYNFIRNNLIISFIKGSGKGGQKRNKTSSTCHLIDEFDYTNYIPKSNIDKYKGVIVIKIDIGRSREKNLEKAIENWEKKLLELFTLKKERTKIDFIETERKLSIKKELIKISGNNKYKNRFI